MSDAVKITLNFRNFISLSPCFFLMLKKDVTILVMRKARVDWSEK
jgi:hypothetical protein